MPLNFERTKNSNYKNYLRHVIKNISCKSKQPIVMGNDCRMMIGWIDSMYMYFYCENHDEKQTWLLTIEFEKLKSFKICKCENLKDTTVILKISPKSAKCVYLKNKNPSKKPDISHKTKSTWMMASSISNSKNQSILDS